MSLLSRPVQAQHPEPWGEAVQTPPQAAPSWSDEDMRLMLDYQKIKAQKTARWWTFAASMTVSGALVPVSIAIAADNFCMFNCKQSNRTAMDVAGGMFIAGAVGHVVSLAVILPLAMSSTNKLKRLEQRMADPRVPQVSLAMDSRGGYAAASWRF